MHPFDDEVKTARDAMKHADELRRIAERRLDESWLRGRHHARTELAIANRAVADTRGLLAQAQEISREPTSRRAVARDQIEAARAELRNHVMYEQWRYLPEHLQAAEAHVDALDTWRDWATGKPVDQQLLVDAVATLHKVAPHQPDGTRQLADALCEWANQRGIQIAPPHIQRGQPMEIEIDL